MSKAVTQMCQYFSETKDQCPQATKKATKEDFENNMYHYDTTKTIAKAYLSNRVFCTGSSIPFSARIEAKENLSCCLFY